MEIFLFCVFSVISTLDLTRAGLDEEFTWTRIEYEWPKSGFTIRKPIVTPESRFGAAPNSAGGRFWDGATTKHSSGSTGTQSRGSYGSQDTIVFEEDLGGNAEGGDPNPSRPQQRPTSSNQQDGEGRILEYAYETNIPFGVNVWRNKLFVTVPRRRSGIPSTLNYVPLDSPNKHNVPLIPYPDWNSNLYPDPSGNNQTFVSVYRVAVDVCDRLWFVDTGILEQPDDRRQVKPTELVIMDLLTDTIIRRVRIPEDHLRENTNLASLTIDVTKDTCGDAFAYIPDLGGYGLIVFSLRTGRSWRVTHNYFYLEPQAGEFNVAGHSFQWNDGIFSVELTDTKPDGSRDLFFHSMAGTHMYAVSTRLLRNETLATRSYHGNDFKDLGDRGPRTQTSSADMHKPTGIMFLGLVNHNALICWNIFTPFSSISIVQRDNQKMIYPCDVKVSNDKVYLLTNSLPEFLFGQLNYDEVNFRVWSGTIQHALQGTNCARIGSGRSGRRY